MWSMTRFGWDWHFVGVQPNFVAAQLQSKLEYLNERSTTRRYHTEIGELKILSETVPHA